MSDRLKTKLRCWWFDHDFETLLQPGYVARCRRCGRTWNTWWEVLGG